MKVFLSASILILTAVATYAQAAPGSNSNPRGKAYRLLLEMPHRVTVTVEMRETAELPWETYISQTQEVSGSDRWHTVQHTGLKLEWIGIGDKTYQKMPDGTWQLQASSNGYTGPTVQHLSKPTVDFKVVENKDGSQVMETRSHSGLQVNATGNVVEMDRKTREWIDAGGRLTRVETEHFNFERKKFQRVTELYEYDPTIKIEAPITN